MALPTKIRIDWVIALYTFYALAFISIVIFRYYYLAGDAADSALFENIAILGSPPGYESEFLKSIQVIIRKFVSNPTEVSIHQKKVAIALLSDGFGEEVNILDPRAEYVRYKSPHYDDALHGMSPQALAFLEPGERMKSVRNNVEGFEKERRRIYLVTSEQEKKLYY